MILTTRQLVCDVCGKDIADGQQMILVRKGRVGRVGGLGLYKDLAVLREITESHRHETCDA